MTRKYKKYKRICITSRYAKRYASLSLTVPKLINIDKHNDFYIVTPLRTKCTISKRNFSLRFSTNDTHMIDLVNCKLKEIHAKGGQIQVSSKALDGGVWPPFIAVEIREQVIVKKYSNYKK